MKLSAPEADFYDLELYYPTSALRRIEKGSVPKDDSKIEQNQH